MRSVVSDALWLAYLAGWTEAVEGNDFKLLDEEAKDRLIMKFQAWLKEMTS